LEINSSRRRLRTSMGSVGGILEISEVCDEEEDDEKQVQ
jgi:hypothetical protein